jgi:ornithine cyclodeaminase/alanine dehydrogenase-like protein (mu-crystallin family)
MPEVVPPLWYLDAATVARHVPATERAIELAGFVLAVVGGSTVARATKVSLRPGSAGTFAQAMPARLEAADALDGVALLGIKWIAGNPANRARGLPAMSSLVVLDDPDTGLPITIMDGSAITAARTAALSGAAIRSLVRAETPPRTALVLGAGVQGRAHLDVLAVCGVTSVSISDRHPERSEELAGGWSRTGVTVSAATDVRAALREVDIVVSTTSLRGSQPWIGPGDVRADVIVLPVDYAAQVTADLVRSAGTFAVDDVDTYREHRAAGRLTGWPDPMGTLGTLAAARAHGEWHRPPGIAVALHQGPGLADVVFASAVLRSALDAGEGVALPR